MNFSLLNSKFMDLIILRPLIATSKKEYIYLNEKVNKNPIAKEHELL